MSKKNRDSSRRVKEMQAAQRKAEQRRRNLIVGAVAVAVIAAVVGIGIAVQGSRDNSGPVAVPAGAVDTYGVARGDANAPVTVDLYEDFQCPICKGYEGWLGDTITKNVDDGTIRVVYHPMAFLDEYSERALETAACVLDENGSAAYLTLHDLLYANQPDEHGPYPSDTDLAALAAKAGADQSQVEGCQSADTYKGWVKAATDEASKAHVTGTPTYRIGGQDIPLVVQDQTQAGAISTFQSAVDAAASAAGASNTPPSSGGITTG